MADDLTLLPYPRHIHWPSVPGEWISRIVHSAAEAAAAIKDGGSLVPVIIGAEGPAPALVTVLADEPDRLEAPVVTHRRDRRR